MRDFFNKVAEHIDKLDAEGQRKQYRLLVEELSFYESVFRSLREGVLVVDAAGNTVYANEAVARLTGFDGAKAKGRPVRHLLPDWDWDNLLAPSGEGRGWTRQASCELAREESARETSRTDAVRDLAAGVAHEIGNPLNAISLNLQLLAREFRREPDEDRRARLLHDIATSQNEVKRLEGIIKGFLSALRPAKLNLVPGSLVDPLTDTLDALKAQFEDRRIQTQLNLPSALPTVLVDRAQMEQVFFNLIKNALEAMKDGGDLDIEVGADDRDVHVVIRDNGSGMDAATLAHIFEPYQTSKEQGSGLGLMLSRRIVHAHGGEIDVESKPGAGTAFTVRIPRLEKRVRRLK